MPDPRAPQTSAAPDPSPRPLHQVEDLAALLGVTPRGARLVLERGELPGFRVGRRWYVRPGDLEAAIGRKIEENRASRDAPHSPDRAPPGDPVLPASRSRPRTRAAPRARASSRDPDAAVRFLRGLPAARNPEELP